MEKYDVNKKHDIPSVPALSQRRQLVSGNGFLPISRSRRARREIEDIRTSGEITAEQARVVAVIKSYGVDLNVALEVHKFLVMEVGQGAIEQIFRRMSENKLGALMEAYRNYANFLAEISPDMPEDLKKELIQIADAVRRQAVEAIQTFELSIDENMQNIPEKKGFFEKFRW